MKAHDAVWIRLDVGGLGVKGVRPGSVGIVSASIPNSLYRAKRGSPHASALGIRVGGTWHRNSR